MASGILCGGMADGAVWSRAATVPCLAINSLNVPDRRCTLPGDRRLNRAVGTYLETNGCWSFSGQLTWPHLAVKIAAVVLRVVMPQK
jgi:hypothetical protein